ncbi:MAG TPA: hypothetical protein VJA26_10225 [Gammaproteobacteria bacterium]|nr:hypothetical protein [Gammaproteobacteria bacterium]
MKQKLFVLMMWILLPGIVVAQSNRNYECTNGGDVRRVEVAYATGAEVPCEVRYYKEGTPEVLWRAQTQTGYCEAQARDFVAKLQSMGWTCSDTGTEAAPTPRDDAAAVGAGVN